MREIEAHGEGRIAGDCSRLPRQKERNESRDFEGQKEVRQVGTVGNTREREEREGFVN